MNPPDSPGSDAARTETVWGAIVERGRLHPDRPFMTEGSTTLTYGEAVETGRAVALGLAASGTGRGDRIALIAEHTLDSWTLLIGCAAAGVVPVLVNWRLAPPEIAFIVSDGGCVAFVTSDRFIETGDGVPIGDSLRRPPLGTFVRRLAELGASASEAGAELDPIDGADDLVQLYTSGTTGLPKGVRTSNASMCALLEALGTELAGIASDSVHLVAAPLFHIAGYGYGLAGLRDGAASVLLAMFDPVDAAMLIEAHRCTNSLLVPAMLQAVVESEPARSRDLSSIRGLLYGASPISEALIRRVVEVFDCRLTQAYGLTETTGVATFLRWDDHELGLAAPEDSAARRRLASAGYPFPGGEVAVLDESGTPCADGTPGEVVARSPLVMSGYWNRPDAQPVDDDGWFHSGDVGYLEDGYLFLVDRLNDKIVTKGENVYPGEIERILGEHPSVLEVAVIGAPDPEFGEKLTAVLVCRDGRSITLAEAQEHCRPHLAGFKLPRELVVSDDPLPRTPSGKILRRVIREPYWSGHDRRVN